jgi:hypothetical protein
MPVSCWTIVKKAGELKPEFLDKSYHARAIAVSRFLHQNGLVHRIATHCAQRPPVEVKEDAFSYIVLVVPKCVGHTHDKNFILNMDQINTYFRMSPRTTINQRGARAINMRQVDDSKRCTVAFTISASGNILKPMVVYQGAPCGRIALRELPLHPHECHYAMQKKAWFDEAVMLDWVENVLALYVATAPAGVIPIVFLDSFKVHLLGSVAYAIKSLGVEVEFIPAGCTGLVQPIDVGFNKPYKSNMSKIYTDFMMGQDSSQPFRGAMRLEVSQWIINAVGGISRDTVVNAWRKTGYSYFVE